MSNPTPCKHSPIKPDVCRICWLGANDARYAALWGLPIPSGTPTPSPSYVKPASAPVTRPVSVSLPLCIHAGDLLPGSQRQELGLSHACPWRPCGHVEKPKGEYVCPRRGCGVSCSGYSPGEEEDPSSLPVAPLFISPPPISTREPLRHLVYHILPVQGNCVWHRSVDELRRRWPLFTGRKIISIATGVGAITQGDLIGDRKPYPAKLSSPTEVRAYLPLGCEVYEVPNNPSKWELASWATKWNALLSNVDDRDYVFYGHAKGVTRPSEFNDVYRLWAEALYTLSLDYWPLVEKALRSRPIAGPFLKMGAFAGKGFEGSKFHYSGNFWWANVGGFRRRWPKIPVVADRWGAEGWAGVAYRADEASSIGPKFSRPLDLYQPNYWKTIAGSELKAWVAVNKPHDWNPASAIRLSVVVPTKGRPTLGRALASVTSQLLKDEDLIVEFDKSEDWGATPRSKGMTSARGTHILFMDDDDIYLPGALAHVRARLAKFPARPHLFRMKRMGDVNDTLWKDPVVKLGNVSTQMFVVPNVPDKFGVWGKGRCGDYDFIASTLALYPPESVVFAPEVISVWRPS